MSSLPSTRAASSNSAVTSSAARRLSFCMSALVTCGSGSTPICARPAASIVASSLCSATYSTVTLPVRPFCSRM